MTELYALLITLALLLNILVVVRVYPTNQLQKEILRLRDWRHKIGDDPSREVLVIVNLLVKRVEYVEAELHRVDGQLLSIPKRAADRS